MKAVVLAGPTLPATEIARRLDATILPPVRQGDIYRLVETHRPDVIGIVDGYFHQVPSVWHKEILWALSRGIAVFGSASMGALRAAELAPFGMIGVGLIYEAFRDGCFPPFPEPFEDDDEVAVVHGPPELGYPPVSEAMVNIRATLRRAERDSVIDVVARDGLCEVAKNLFYGERTWERILERSGDTGPNGNFDHFRDWLPEGRVDQKRVDALAMLEAMRETLETGREPAEPRFRFEHTSQWDLAVRGFHRGEDLPAPVLVEVALMDEAYPEIRARAEARLLAMDSLAASQGGQPVGVRDALDLPPAERMGEELAIRHREPASVDALFARELAAAELERFAGDAPPAVLARHMIDELKRRGAYARYLERAEDKARVLDTLGRPLATVALRGPEDLQLLDWFFNHRFGRDLPEDVGQYAVDHGFDDEESFIQAVFDEYLYCMQDTAENRREAGDAV